MAGQVELEAFLCDPEQFVAPGAPRPLPPPDLLPARRSPSEVKTMFPKRFEIQGFCPVTYVDGQRRYVSTTWLARINCCICIIMPLCVSTQLTMIIMLFSFGQIRMLSAWEPSSCCRVQEEAVLFCI